MTIGFGGSGRYPNTMVSVRVHSWLTAPWRSASQLQLLLPLLTIPLLLLCSCSCRRGSEVTAVAAAVSQDAAPTVSTGEGKGNEDLGIVSAESPDKVFFATAREIPNANYLHRRDLDGLAVEVLRWKDGGWWEIYARHDFRRIGIADPDHRAAHFQWSPDSQYLVFTTSSFGGHSPWHFPAYVFCVGDKSFRYLDRAFRDVSGDAVTSPDFHFEAPDTLVMSSVRLVGGDKIVNRQLRANISELAAKAEIIEPVEPAE